MVGGQATNFWAWYFQDLEPELKLAGPFTSEDIDYFGTVSVARSLAEATQGKLLVATLDDHTPNTAIVETTINGKPIKIDFLNGVLGVKNAELTRGVVDIQAGGESGGKAVGAIIRLMHPVACLKSRVANILHPATRRTDKISKNQLRAAFVVVRRYIQDCLAEGDRKEAQACISALFEYARSDRYGRTMDIELGLDVLDILRPLMADDRLDARYRKHQIKQMISGIERRRRSRKSVKASSVT
ncbi:MULTISPECIES: hypothetical protein [unclassified Bradyrhizobium]|uniref:hypothetical protein n=1 Tax=unclassified Bradyrhizobium TaxID=2631580 RepID=UPI0029163FEA|nr:MULTISPECIES: hypothetical protein [unclassified Bradyrhizobium]